jgi:hypothetical protein
MSTEIQRRTEAIARMDVRRSSMRLIETQRHNERLLAEISGKPMDVEGFNKFCRALLAVAEDIGRECTTPN